jgi:hypothetical protein
MPQTGSITFVFVILSSLPGAVDCPIAPVLI